MWGFVDLQVQGFAIVLFSFLFVAPAFLNARMRDASFISFAILASMSFSMMMIFLGSH